MQRDKEELELSQAIKINMPHLKTQMKFSGLHTRFDIEVLSNLLMITRVCEIKNAVSC